MGKKLVFCICFIIAASSRAQVAFPQAKKQKTSKEQEKISFKYETYFFKALKEKSLENYEIALKQFQKCIGLKPNEPQPYYESALINQKLGNLEIALEQSRKSVLISEKNTWYLTTYADLLFSTQNYQSAAENYKKLIKQEPGNESYYFMLSDTYIYARKYQKAIDVYDDLEKHKGIDKMLCMQKHKLYMELRQVKKALLEIEKITNNFPEDIQALEILAEGYLLNDQKAKAFEVFKKISSLDPTNARIRLTLADYYRDEGNNEKSFEQLSLAFESKKLNIDAKVAILVSYIPILEDELYKNQAIELCKKLMLIHNGEPKAHAVYGDILYASGEKEKSLDQYLIVVDIDKNHSQVWSQILFICAEKNNFRKVLEYSTEALLIFPTNPLYYYFNGVSNNRYKQYKSAVKSLTMGLEFIFDNDLLEIEFCIGLADAYHGLSNFPKSDSLYDFVLKKAPENTIVLNNYSYYLSLRKKNLDKAKEMSKKANELDPNNGTFQDTYAWILYQNQEYSEAKKWMEKAISNSTTPSSVIIEHYGDILYKLDDPEAALIQWKKALSLGSESEVLLQKIKDKTLYE